MRAFAEGAALLDDRGWPGCDARWCAPGGGCGDRWEEKVRCAPCHRGGEQVQGQHGAQTQKGERRDHSMDERPRGRETVAPGGARSDWREEPRARWE
ncbi:MAG: hypothetical protein ACRDMZ_05790, partial [Solirubrobacteraceae bacterium]